MPVVATKRNPDQRPIRLVPPELPLADAANLIQITAERQTARIAAGLVSFAALLVLGSAGLVLVMAVAVGLGVTWLTPRVAHTHARTQRALAGARAAGHAWLADARTAGRAYATKEAARRNQPVRQANIEFRRMTRAFEREGVKFPGDLRVTAVDVLPPGRRFTITRPNLPASLLERQLPAIAAYFRAGQATLDVGAGRGRANMAWVQLHERDPFELLPSKLVVPAELTAPHSVLDPMPIGKGADASIVRLAIRPGVHTLVAATTGGGKDNTCGVEVAWCAYAGDCELYIVDMKGGLDWSRWAHCCVSFGKDDTTARTTLSAFIAEMKRRESILEQLGLSKVTIGPADPAKPSQFPLMKLLVSEVLELDERCWALLGSAVRLSRATGGSITLNTQEPRMEAMKDKTVRGNLIRRIALQCEESKHYTMILGRDADEQERRVLTKPGRAVVKQGTTSLLIQVFWIGDGDSPNDPVVRIAQRAPSALRTSFGIHDRNPNPDQVLNHQSELSEERPQQQPVIPACIASGGKGAKVFASLTALGHANTSAVAAHAGVDWGTAKPWLDRMHNEGAIHARGAGRETIWTPRYLGHDVTPTYDAGHGEQEEGEGA
jgi:hypothetical protein